MLTAIYPPCIVLVALSFCKDFWHEQGRILGPVMLVSFLFGLIDALKGAGLADWMPTQMAHLPLSEQGLAWLVPSVMTNQMAARMWIRLAWMNDMHVLVMRKRSTESLWERACSRKR